MAHAQPEPAPAPPADAPHRRAPSTASDPPPDPPRRRRPPDDAEHAPHRPTVVSGRVDEYRECCLKLEKIRHARVYEAEKRILYSENAVLATYQQTVQAVLEEHEAGKRARIMKALNDNAEKTRQVEELRYGICKDDVPGTWQRRHEMSLRGRNNTERDDEPQVDDKPRRRKDMRQKVKVNVELEEAQVMVDLAEMRGEKRPREEPVPERRSKKRK